MTVAVENDPKTLRISPISAAASLAGVLIVLVAISAAQHWLVHVGAIDDKVWILDVDQEGAIYTWASSLLIALNGVLLMLLFATSRRYRVAWFSLALLFFALSLDEILDLHNKTGAVMQWLWPVVEISSPMFSWTIVGFAAVALVFLLYLRFWLSLATTPRLLFAVAAVLYIAGALVVELVAGEYAVAGGHDSLEYGLVTSLEEMLEGIGQVVFLFALLRIFVERGGMSVAIGSDFAPRQVAVPLSLVADQRRP